MIRLIGLALMASPFMIAVAFGGWKAALLLSAVIAGGTVLAFGTVIWAVGRVLDRCSDGAGPCE